MASDHPTCEACDGMSHHWLRYASEAMPCGWYECKHCEATGIECIDCDGEGCNEWDEDCEKCWGEGVEQVTFSFCLGCGSRDSEHNRQKCQEANRHSQA